MLSEREVQSKFARDTIIVMVRFLVRVLQFERDLLLLYLDYITYDGLFIKIFKRSSWFEIFVLKVQLISDLISLVILVEKLTLKVVPILRLIFLLVRLLF